MTDIQDNRDEPPKKRIGANVETDWLRLTMSEAHQQWLNGNGKLTATFVKNGWAVQLRNLGLGQQDAAIDWVVTSYTTELQRVASVRPIPTYGGFGKMMEMFEAGFAQRLRESQPELSDEQSNKLVEICADFRVHVIQRHFKAGVEMKRREG